MRRLSLGLGFGTSSGGGGGAAAAPVTAVAADGWTATYDGALPTTTLGDDIEEAFAVTRAGYSSAGATTTFDETIRVATPRRAAGALTHDTGLVALSSYVMDDDSISGCTNSSTLVSPTPVANFVTPDRLTVVSSIGGSDCPVEVFADHWSGIACVIFRIAKGGTTISVTVASSAISAAGSNLDGAIAWDRTPLPVYALPATDISTLAGDGQVTVDAEVYPRVGVAASVNNSATNTSGGGARREFTTRYFDKRARGYVYAYVDGSTGVDATGVWLAAPTASPANPFLTIKGAMDAIDDAGQLAITSGVVDGCRIRLRNTATYAVANPAANLVQNTGALIIERDPDTTASASNSTVNFANAAWRPRLASGFAGPLTRGWLVLREVTLSRTGAVGSIAGESVGPVFLTTVLDNCRQDFAGFNGTYFAASGGINFHAHYGTQLLNFTSTGMAYNAGNQTQILRGVNLTCTASLQPECFATYTSKFSGVLNTFNTSDFTKGLIFFGNELRSTNNAILLNPSAADGATMGGVVVGQNLFEYIHTTASTAGFGFGQDAGSTSHSLIYNNSGTGWGGTGRWNMAYDRFVGATKQSHPFLLFQGNILPQFNIKGDKWKLSQAHGTPAIFDGNLAFDHGVLCEGNVKVFNSNEGGVGATAALRGPTASENQTYAGRNTFRNEAVNSHYAIDSTVEWTDLYTTYAGLTETAPAGSGNRTAGAGGGDFSLAASSPAESRLVVPRRTKDFASNTVTAPDSAGAYYT